MDWHARKSSKIFVFQYTWIRETFGKKSADNANYGWGTEDADEYLRVATKVYGHGVLISIARYGRPMEHIFEEF